MVSRELRERDFTGQARKQRLPDPTGWWQDFRDYDSVKAGKFLCVSLDLQAS